MILKQAARPSVAGGYQAGHRGAGRAGPRRRGHGPLPGGLRPLDRDFIIIIIIIMIVMIIIIARTYFIFSCFFLLSQTPRPLKSLFHA